MIATLISTNANPQVQSCKSFTDSDFATYCLMDIDSDKDLIESLVKFVGKSASAIAKEVGLTPSTLTRPLNHDVNHQLSKQTLDKLKRRYPLFPGFSSEHPVNDVIEIEMIREVDISYAMGDGSIVEDYPSTGVMPFARNFLSALGVPNSDNIFICRGDGDSMQPTIFDSDLVMIDTSRKRITMHDKIWALTVAGAGMIKRVRPLPSGEIMVLSDNPSVPHQVFDGEDVHIVGKVVWIGRRM